MIALRLGCSYVAMSDTMNNAWDNRRVRRVATLIAHEDPAEKIHEILINEGLSEEEAYLTYMAGRAYLALVTRE